MIPFFKNQIQLVRSPGTYLKGLLHNPNNVKFGFSYLIFGALLYGGAFILWAFGADTVTFPAFLKIPEETYYLFELIFVIPLFIITWLLASGIAYLLVKSFGGKGSFDLILAGYGISMSVSLYPTLIPDYIQGILWVSGIVPFEEYMSITGEGIWPVIIWTYMLAYSFLHIFFYSMTIYHTQSISKNKSWIIGTLSYLLSFAVWITYMR